MNDNRITWRALGVGAFFSALFAALSIYINTKARIVFAATQISVLPYLLLVLMVLAINPLLRLVRIIRAFSLVELMVIFIMGMVSSGIPNFGLVEQVLPIAGSLMSSEWNNPQSEWSRYVVPYINDAYFLAEPGTRDAAVDYYAEMKKLNDLEETQKTAAHILNLRTRMAEAEAVLKGLESSEAAESGKDRTRKQALRRAQLDLETLRSEADVAEAAWLKLALPAHTDPNEVLRDYPDRISSQTAVTEAAKLRLKELEERAFEKVAEYRRGLPRKLSAYPGIFPMPQDDWSSYTGRLRRLVEGRAALTALKEARRVADTDPDLVPNLLRQAEEVLIPLANIETHQGRLAIVRADEELLLTRHAEVDESLKALNIRRRQAARAEALDMADDVSRLSRELQRIEDRREELRIVRERCTREFDCATNIGELVERIALLRQTVEQNGCNADEVRSEIKAILPDFAAADISLRRYFIGEVPWHVWARPLGRWTLLIGLSYLALLSLNVLIFRQWAHNEMITYPLAELPKALVYTDRPGGGMPDIFRNGLFWMGMAISGSVLGWNLLCKSQVVPGLSPLNLNNLWSDYVGNTPLQVLMNWKSEVFFTMIGLAFLIPKNISFSLWFFYLLYMCLLLILYWSGHIDTEGTSQWWYMANIKTSIGAGAMLVFASVVLYKCRRYILCVFHPSVLKDLESDEQRELRYASWAFMGASLGIVLQLWLDMGANLFYTVFFYLVLLLIIIAMVRAVAEGGLLAVKTYINPFHYVRAFCGFDKAYSAVPLFTPLLMYCGMLFLDLKVFIAPAMANALKLRNDFRMRRGAFHLALLLAIGLAAIVASLTSIMMCYDCGADNMSTWFYTGWPRSTMNTLTSMAKNPPVASTSSAIWMTVGGVLTAVIVYMRQYLFWMPHPLGLVMLVNPIMQSYWFSIFLGWLANSAITKYGHKNTYARACGFFIGLIVGELVLVSLSAIVSMITGVNINIDLNRN
ncbi:MAG: DUF6785 family protein [Kiritimatiellia bacterium]